MKFTEHIRLAFKAIKGNLLRTLLTLGIIAIGIMALVGILTAVDAIKASMNSSLSSMGANTFDIKKWRTRRNENSGKVIKNIAWDETQQFKDRFSFPGSITSVSTSANFFGILKNEKDETKPTMRVMGVDENYIDLAGYELLLGRNFSSLESTEGRQVVIIGDAVVSKLFDRPEQAIDKTVNVDNVKCMVIGVLSSKGSGSAFNADEVALLPVQLVRNKYQANNRTYVVSVAVDNAENIGIASEEATGLMRAIRKLPFGSENDFEVAKSDKLANSLIEDIQYVTVAATTIGLITLFGAAVGLMNIMLVSVAERTREIGISKAIGASKSAIRNQYLIESIVISILGGLFGIMLGIAAGNGVSVMLGGPFIVPWLWILSGILFCAIVGLGAGLYPAIKASNLDPIESLRYE